jgi:acetylornithine/succinyldiaminopimelate/putrescine aminotransferase
MNKQQALELSRKHICPNRVEMLGMLGVDLVIGKRQGYRIWDVEGHELIDVHINGGTFNLGHCNPEIVATLVENAPHLDIGNHHFPSTLRAELGAALSATTGDRLSKVVLSASGSEAVDVALKSARRATGRRRVVGIQGGYHGRTGLSGAAGDSSSAAFFLSDLPDEFTAVPFNDIAALDAALRGGDVAAVILETIPATLGFPLPSEGYLPKVKELCEAQGALYIADEVQTGLGRTGKMWAFQRFGVEPDIAVTGKGLSGGMYPISATLLSERAGGWLSEDGWAHVSTFGGSELGCVVALKALEITERPSTVDHVDALALRLTHELERLSEAFPFLAEVRQCGLVIGLKFDDPMGGMKMSKALYDHGVWAMFAGFDRSVLQFKPGILLSREDADVLLSRVERALEAVTRA